MPFLWCGPGVLTLKITNSVLISFSLRIEKRAITSKFTLSAALTPEFTEGARIQRPDPSTGLRTGSAAQVAS